ncbi:MAG: hypothetical protein KC636_27840 [Myxococcales bacterium]|nr:hypothetical protein [Myxococcales bacterium]
MHPDNRYDALVNATSREEAIAIAAEATPRDRRVVQAIAVDVSAEHGPDTWYVTLEFGAASARS